MVRAAVEHRTAVQWTATMKPVQKPRQNNGNDLGYVSRPTREHCGSLAEVPLGLTPRLHGHSNLSGSYILARHTLG